jgi:hypothetical protein
LPLRGQQPAQGLLPHREAWKTIQASFIQCCGSESGIPDPVPFLSLVPGSGIGFYRISDPGSRNHFFWKLNGNCLTKKISIILCKLGQTFLLHQFKNKIILNFVIFCGKKRYDNNFFKTLSLVFTIGSGIRDG